MIMNILSAGRMRRNKMRIASLVAFVLLFTCTGALGEREEVLPYRFASVEEGVSLLMSNEDYYAGFSQNDLDYKMQKSGATMEEYQAFAQKQVLEFSQEEQQILNDAMARVRQVVEKHALKLPPIDEIVFVKTTQEEENGAGAYTHGTTIYLGQLLMDSYTLDYSGHPRGDITLWHELFHCLTRQNPDFRSDMYKIIHFTVEEQDFPIPPSVQEYFISNPDVERHNSWARFHIDGKDIDCFTALITTKHFEQPGDRFFDCMVTALVPVDGSDVFYTPEQASNFYDVFGRNTSYVIDPEECLADNFALTMMFGLEGEDYKEFPSPEIIEAIRDYLCA